MWGVWTLSACLTLGPGEPPAPALDPAGIEELDEGEAEGPVAPKAAGETETEAEAEAGGPGEGAGIEWAVPPPSEAEDAEAEAEEDEATPLPEPSWPDPGDAPNDGSGMFVAGGILIPTAVLATWALSFSQAAGPLEGPTDIRVPVIVTGAGMGLIGVGLLGLGTYRRIKLQRWQVAYRVRATPQGGGMLSGGGIAANFGAVLTAVGIFAFARGFGGPLPPVLLGVGLASVGVAAPTLLVFGQRRRRHYLATGGWYRPPIPELRPEVRVTPTLVPGGFGVGLSGRF